LGAASAVERARGPPHVMHCSHSVAVFTVIAWPFVQRNTAGSGPLGVGAGRSASAIASNTNGPMLAGSSQPFMSQRATSLCVQHRPWVLQAFGGSHAPESVGSPPLSKPAAYDCAMSSSTCPMVELSRLSPWPVVDMTLAKASTTPRGDGHPMYSSMVNLVSSFSCQNLRSDARFCSSVGVKAFSCSLPIPTILSMCSCRSLHSLRATVRMGVG
jgi:hypothetical protein